MKVVFEVLKKGEMDGHAIRSVFSAYCASIDVHVESCLTLKHPAQVPLVSPDWHVLESERATVLVKFVEADLRRASRDVWANTIIKDGIRQGEILGFVRHILKLMEGIK